MRVSTRVALECVCWRQLSLSFPGFYPHQDLAEPQHNEQSYAGVPWLPKEPQAVGRGIESGLCQAPPSSLASLGPFPHFYIKHTFWQGSREDSRTFVKHLAQCLAWQANTEYTLLSLLFFPSKVYLRVNLTSSSL